MTFNLLTAPWIPAQTTDGTLVTWGLTDTLTRAHELRCLEAESPMQQVAVHRLLLAVAHRALGGPVDDDQWASWWRAGRLDAAAIGAYLHRHADRFDLWHPQHPFAQAAALESGILPVDKLTAYPDRGVGAGWFHPVPTEITEADAARWLLWTHCYDGGGIRSRHGGNKEMGCPSGHAGWAAQLQVQGRTLAETLLLSMVTYRPDPEDVGWWERVDPPHRRRDQTVTGLVGALTWPSRRVRLHRDPDGMVRRVQVCAGDDAKHLPGDPHTMRPWPADSNLTHLTPGRISEMVGAPPPSHEDVEDQPAEAPTQPGVLAVLGRRAAGGHLDADHPVRVSATTVRYDHYRSMIEDAGTCDVVIPAEAFASGSPLARRAAWVDEVLYRAERSVVKAVSARVRASRRHLRLDVHLRGLTDTVTQMRAALTPGATTALTRLGDDAAPARFGQCAEQLADERIEAEMDAMFAGGLV